MKDNAPINVNPMGRGVQAKGGDQNLGNERR